ncbi:hypothetical protein ACRE_073230 [Hapsidospora chrysogenum ATCC 11550]|uniref:Glycosyltransferase family 31 protein n=1 Tax=Hapsidospora chrysogenum (strain ATCC 11550 / CBS 779.69 / DSM 880 / IAM 14645 / JCM 23072 / IMI 49137) TaxID=857340 RepID=A0A086SXW1_HAPC1|nr:hypothetical protein ACRE_073230 [Hapsidospora chrysogenum ATCC 11550]
MRLISLGSSGPTRRILFVTCFLFFLIVLLVRRETETQGDSFFGSDRYRLSLKHIVTDDDLVDDNDRDSSNESTPEKPPGCPLDVEYLKSERYGLSGNIIFHKQCVRAHRNDSLDRSAVTDVEHGSIFGRLQALDLNADCHEYEAMPCDPIDLEVPGPLEERPHPELLFGVATSFDRLVDSLPQLSHWLSHSGSPLVAVVVDVAQREGDIPGLVALYDDHGVNLIIARPMDTPPGVPQLGVNEHHFTVLRDMVRHSTPQTKWIGIIDDDTFFPSLHPVAEMLEDQDHTASLYLGGLSDSMWAIQQHGMLAYGGAGVFLSMPLARELDPYIERCLAENMSPQGDALLRNCIYARTETRLTVVGGLHQLDIRGDPSGFYESGRWPLSLHHWKTWHSAPVDQMAVAAGFCGDCFLQRWRIGGDTVLSNGYSVAVYSGGIAREDLDRTEATFENAHLYDWAYGPLRSRVEDGMKKSYLLVGSQRIGRGLRQVYVHRGGGMQPDEVLELRWDWA